MQKHNHLLRTFLGCLILCQFWGSIPAPAQFHESFENPTGIYQEGIKGIGLPSWSSAAQPFYNLFVPNWNSGHGKAWITDLPKNPYSNPYWLNCNAADGEKAAVMFVDLSYPNTSVTANSSIYLNYSFLKGQSYTIKYKIKVATLGGFHVAYWNPMLTVVLTNGLTNTNYHVLPNIPSNSSIIQDLQWSQLLPIEQATANLNKGLSFDGNNVWIEQGVCVTPTENFEQLWFRPSLNGLPFDNINSTEMHYYVLLDDIHIDREPEPCCDANFTYRISTHTPNIVTFTPDDWSTYSNGTWNFGDGSSSAIPISKVFHNPGSYNVCYHVSGENGECTVCQVICIENLGLEEEPWEPPVVSLEHLYPPVSDTCDANFSVIVNTSHPNRVTVIPDAFSGVMYWNFGDGVLNPPTTGGLTYTYSSGGAYTICLTTGGIKTGCTKCLTICLPETQDGNEFGNYRKINKENTFKMNVYPNPAKELVTVSFTVNKATNASVRIVDVTGRIVTNVTNENMASGNHDVKISTSNLPAGIYNVVVKTDAGSHTERLTVIK